MKSVSRSLNLFLPLLNLLLAGFAAPVWADCMPMAKTPYEKVYCEIKNQGKGKGLPDFAQFQSNTATTQALLLKRPAARLGIELPKSARESKPSSTSSVPPGSSQENGDQVTKRPASSPRAMAKTNPVDNGRAGLPTPDVTASIATRCHQPQKSRIDCGVNRYQLQGDQPNSKLALGVLGDDNGFEFPDQNRLSKEGTGRDHYLSKSYRYYIEKMLEIGLGGSTMSYSRFYYTYVDLQDKGHDFGGRFATMFEYLKRDKRQLMVGKSADPAFEGLKQCMALDAELIVCDNLRTNWVYRLQQ
ncbi:hypothetical protein MIB92_12755 [Aestuariirhabdus sp. Z084]|uniref:hypothetical protein n=1 Tax=Aestuariirhabdus haliotis TaxID=2918751 RepID=UPI00201B3FDB|nr:hypothetical protein [Aestuariirhabdus haliotis]MCL6416522.1 hypothetical protein [Aestuariirhabdus haliotis]MCL6420512.1 hypothetical protein [Aestuariirhabdus haliotis]